MQLLTRGWLIHDMTGSPFLVAMVTAAMMLPMLLLSLVGGVLADRMDRRRLIIASDVSFVITFTLLFLLVATDRVAPWHIFAVSVANGVAFALAVSARQALISGLVHREQLRTAVGMSALTFNTSQIIGPAMAGVLLPTLGPSAALATSAVLVLPAIYLYSTLRPAHQPVRGSATGSVIENVKAGISYAINDATIRLLMLGSLVMILTVGPFQSLMPVFAEDVLHVGAGGLSVLLLAAGLGSLAGSITVISIGDRWRHESIELVMGLLAAAALAGFAFSPWFPLSIVMVGFTGFAMTAFMVTNMTVVQVVVPDKLQGRVMSVRFLVIGLMPVGAASIGGVAETAGAPIAVGVAALIGGFLFLLVQVKGRRASVNATHRLAE